MLTVTSDKMVGPMKFPFSYPGTYRSFRNCNCELASLELSFQTNHKIIIQTRFRKIKIRGEQFKLCYSRISIFTIYEMIISETTYIND